MLLGVRQTNGQPGIVRHDQQPLGIGIEPSRRKDPGQVRRQQVVDGLPPALVAAGSHSAARLVEGQGYGAPRLGPLAAPRDLLPLEINPRQWISLDAAIDSDFAGLNPTPGLLARAPAEL